MTADEGQFLNELWHTFTTYTHNESIRKRISDPDYEGDRELHLSLLSAMIEVIEQYFRDTLGYYDSNNDFQSSGNDDNLFATAEIQEVIDHANRIMGTTVYIDLE